MIAAQGLDDGLGSAARVQTASGRSTVTPERFERRAKPSRLFEQLLKAPFDTVADLFKARHSSQILMIEGAPVPFPELMCWVERDATPPSQHATLASDTHDKP